MYVVIKDEKKEGKELSKKEKEKERKLVKAEGKNKERILCSLVLYS